MSSIWTVFFLVLSAVAVAAPFLKSVGGKEAPWPQIADPDEPAWTAEELRGELAAGRMDEEEYSRIAGSLGYAIGAAVEDEA